MGNCVGGFKRGRRIIPWKRNKPMVICFIGLEGAGKTTIVKALQGEDLHTVHSTVGFSRAEFEVKGYRLTAYDLGGNERIRDIWKNYYAEVFAVVYVLNAAGESQMEQNKEYLQEYQQFPELQGKPLLILLNKKDLPDAIDEMQFSDECGLHKMAKKIGAGIRVESVCAVQGTGPMIDPCILDAFDWLIDQVLSKYDDIEKGVATALVKLKERQSQERLERQHRLAAIAAVRQADTLDPDASARATSFSETVDEKTETDDNKIPANGTLAEAANEIAKNEAGVYEPEPVSRIQRILQHRKRTKIAPEPAPPDETNSIRMTDLMANDESGRTDKIVEPQELRIENLEATSDNISVNIRQPSIHEWEEIRSI
uniref:ADP-ribosylation factor-like protein 13B n=1 Tax=Panagrellus redivivus TaxID=6233 RepID=A0A7E4UPU5_PANRE